MSINKLKLFLAQNKQSMFDFFIIGSFSAIIYLSLFSLLWNILQVNYKLAVTISYITSTGFYFITNRKITFKSHQQSIYEQIKRFAVLMAINYLITIVIVWFCKENLSLPPYLGIMISIGATFILNYFLGRFWVFHVPIKSFRVQSEDRERGPLLREK